MWYIKIINTYPLSLSTRSNFHLISVNIFTAVISYNYYDFIEALSLNDCCEIKLMLYTTVILIINAPVVQTVKVRMLYVRTCLSLRTLHCRDLCACVHVTLVSRTETCLLHKVVINLKFNQDCTINMWQVNIMITFYTVARTLHMCMYVRMRCDKNLLHFLSCWRTEAILSYIKIRKGGKLGGHVRLDFVIRDVK